MTSPRLSYGYALEVCDLCKGHGYLSRDVLTDYHRGEYDEERTPCHGCETTGRVNVKVTTERTPYVCVEKYEGRF